MSEEKQSNIGMFAEDAAASFPHDLFFDRESGGFLGFSTSWIDDDFKIDKPQWVRYPIYRDFPLVAAIEEVREGSCSFVEFERVWQHYRFAESSSGKVYVTKFLKWLVDRDQYEDACRYDKDGKFIFVGLSISPEEVGEQGIGR